MIGSGNIASEMDIGAVSRAEDIRRNSDKLSGIKPGDRVRVTFEAICRSTGGRYEVEGQSGDVMFSHDAQAAPTFQIERIEPPLKVGCKVARRDRPAYWREDFGLRVLALRGDHAVVESWDGLTTVGGVPFGVVLTTDLERIA